MTRDTRHWADNPTVLVACDTASNVAISLTPVVHISITSVIRPTGRSMRPGNGDRFKFTGMEFDSETGYYRARFYDPAAGRFLSSGH